MAMSRLQNEHYRAVASAQKGFIQTPDGHVQSDSLLPHPAPQSLIG